MAVGTSINCKYCIDFKNDRCDGTEKNCLCRLALEIQDNVYV